MRLDVLGLLDSFTLLNVRHANVDAEHENVVFAQRIVDEPLLTIAQYSAICKHLGFRSRYLQSTPLLHEEVDVGVAVGIILDELHAFNLMQVVARVDLV